MLETKTSNVKLVDFQMLFTKRKKSALFLNLIWKYHYKCRVFEKNSGKKSRKLRTETEGGRGPLDLCPKTAREEKKDKMLRVTHAEPTCIELRIHYTQHSQDSEIFLWVFLQNLFKTSVDLRSKWLLHKLFCLPNLNNFSDTVSAFRSPTVPRGISE